MRPRVMATAGEKSGWPVSEIVLLGSLWGDLWRGLPVKCKDIPVSLPCGSSCKAGRRADSRACSGLSRGQDPVREGQERGPHVLYQTKAKGNAVDLSHRPPDLQIDARVGP